MAMIKAQEMFEELGYRRSTDIDAIAYSEKLDGTFYHFEITFDLLEKEIVIGTNMEYVIESDLLQAIIQQAKELGWLEEKDEHFEEKAETNAEHYLNDLLKIGRHFCFMHEKVKNCCDVGCDVCTFGKDDCDKERFKWLASQYKKPTYKLSQFEYDLIQTYSYVHEGYTLSKFKRLIKLKDKGYFKCADYDTKIQDILANCEVI